jgi:hypothetical protein
VWLKGSKVKNNCGIFGGIYVIGEFILSLTSCKFEDNRGIFEGCCVHIMSRVIFESDECIFKNCNSSIIYFEVIPKFVRFGDNCLKCSGFAIFSRVRIELIVTGCVCFEGYKLAVENNILFSVFGMGMIEYNCFSLSEDIDEEEAKIVIEKDERRLKGCNEMSIEIFIDENESITSEKCSDSPLKGQYNNCDFVGRAEIYLNLILLNCKFEDIKLPDEIGGTVLICGMEFIAMNTIWKNCCARIGGGVAIRNPGSGKLMNCTFRSCGILGHWNDSGGGALALIEGGNCTSEYCYFEQNVDGSVWMNGPGIFRNCNFIDNSGYCGGLYVNGDYDSRLRLFVCYFESNKNSFASSHIYFEQKCIFSASNSLFVWSKKSSIFFSVYSKSIVNFSSCCFRGFGHHLWFPEEGGLILFTVNDLYFENSKSDAISGFFPDSTDEVNIFYNCQDCVSLNTGATSMALSSFVKASSSHWRREIRSPFVSFSYSVLSSLSESMQDSVISDSLSGSMIPVIVVSGLILIVVVFVGLWLWFRCNLRNDVRSTETINFDLEMSSADFSSNTELS